MFIYINIPAATTIVRASPIFLIFLTEGLYDLNLVSAGSSLKSCKNRKQKKYYREGRTRKIKIKIQRRKNKKNNIVS